MNIINGIQIVKNKKGEWWSNIEGNWKQYTEQTEIDKLYKIKRYCKTNKKQCLELIVSFTSNIDVADEVVSQLASEQLKATVEDCADKLINFFKEFDFEPNFRFYNTLTRICAYQTLVDAKDYVTNYFNLTGNANTQVIKEKLNSLEFEQIICNLANVRTSKKVNSRFKLYYGSQGTGKTTQAMQEAYNNVMVCHSAMLPSDLMEDFKFNDGKAAFTPSALCKAMTNGEIIVLDEINLLPFESLRFLQSILDGKSQFDYKGQTIEIKDNFKIIGTMNLQVNGMIYALPEPLVDRAEELKEFKLTAKSLIGALL